MKRYETNIRNRLLSIKHDSNFASFVLSKFPFPCCPNERAGTWYVSPEQRSGSKVYFKSTDGHFGKWDISLKRLNLSVLPLLYECGGLTIIDTTRRGKRFPDALSKTIPIWCAVLNAVSFEAAPILPYIPQTIVSLQEIDQINQ